MKWLNDLIDKFRKHPHMHLCDVCRKPMEANGYGLCEECMDAVDRYDSEDFHTYMVSARNRPGSYKD